ncbi:MAG: hypothetical protein H2184_09365 [Candidatus Galacturonibacter soehngenii]|nr:hypothetical protein [Candidatus Galacturonibacter soehngenii]
MKDKKILSIIMSVTLLLTISTVKVYASTYAEGSEDVEVYIDNVDNGNSTREIDDDTGRFYNDQVDSPMVTISELPDDTVIELQEGYKEILDYASKIGVPLNLEFVDFVNGFNEGTYDSVNAYIDVFYSLLKPIQSNNQITSRSSGSSKYYYNIGTSLPSTVIPNYSKYNLLSTVQKGDVIYEANGGFGITGHIAIVEGFFYNASQDVTYIRIIEAIDVGVCRSLLDDTRVDDRATYILRVDSASSTIKNQAITFCIDEIGSNYLIDFAKDTSSSETDWYCSELVWAAYKNQGIDIEREPLFSEPGVTPRDIYNSNKVTSINFK